MHRRPTRLERMRWCDYGPFEGALSAEGSQAISVATKIVRKKRWQVSPYTRLRGLKRIHRWDGLCMTLIYFHLLNVGY